MKKLGKIIWEIFTEYGEYRYNLLRLHNYRWYY